jgi:hypothetical protein
MQQAADGNGRLYGLDWLRIGAFALLIFYHIGMFFVPWGWHVKSAQPQEWLELPMLAVNPWRLMLLFLISGVASRALIAKLRAPGAFVRGRSARLLVPLAAGMILFVAPQPWAELQEKAGYEAGSLHFWLNDYFVFRATEGVITPTWNHLWFVAYLWIYSMLLAGLTLLPAAARAALQRAFDRFFAGWRLLVLPVLMLFALRAFLYPLFGETHAVVDDPYAHATYAFAFFFGVGLARSPGLWARLTGAWKPWLLLGLAGYGVIVALDISIAGESGQLELLASRFARSVQAWGTILGLLGFAQLRLHRDGPVRRYLTEAIFPWYIAHQTIIVLVGHALRGASLGPAAEFGIILAATVAGCAATYEAGRRIGWLRPLIGLSPLPRPRQSPAAIPSRTEPSCCRER